MKERSILRQATLLGMLALGPALAAPAQTPGAIIRNHFDTDAVMRAPGFFDFSELGAPGPAEWIVIFDQNPPSAPNQLTQTVANRPADAIAVAIRRNVSFRDGQLSVALKRASGRGGILLRMSSEKDFLVLLVDTFSGDARLVSYRGGKASELSRGQAGFRRDWGVLTIHASGEEVRALWEDKPLFSAKDPKPSIGRTGLATAGPGNAMFDEFILQAASEK